MIQYFYQTCELVHFTDKQLKVLKPLYAYKNHVIQKGLDVTDVFKYQAGKSIIEYESKQNQVAQWKIDYVQFYDRKNANNVVKAMAPNAQNSPAKVMNPPVA